MQTRAAPKESAGHASKPLFDPSPTRSTFFSPRVQAKLTMGTTGDRFEREADEVADRVVQRMAAGPVSAGSAPSVQAACATCAGPTSERDEDVAVQAKTGGSAETTGAAVDANVESSIHALPGSGSPLPGSVRSQLEPQFDADFSGVRVHTDSQAHGLARSLNAHAFTVGQDIVFAPGRFAPHTTDGTRLLAHELTHVMQQARHPIDPRNTEPVDSHAEQEAHDVSARVVSGEPAPMPRAVPGGITRDVGWAGRGPIPDPYGMGYNTILRNAGSAAEPAVRDLAFCEDVHMNLDVLRFQSLSIARRFAVLRLQPHAAGTACEPWFPQLQPSRLTDAEIEASPEFQEYTDPGQIWQKTHQMTDEEGHLAGRLILRQLREGRPVTWNTDAGVFMTRARAQLGVLAQTERLVGDLNWSPFNTTAAVNNPAALPTEFGRWVLAGGPEPNAVSGRINCWEMVLFGAYRGGFLTFSRIQTIYRLAVDNVRNGLTRLVGDTVETELRRGNENILNTNSPTSPEPLPGDVVIFNTAATHVAISRGTKNSAGEHEVLSLWNEPNAISHVQRTTIEALVTSATAAGAVATPVRFWSANW